MLLIYEGILTPGRQGFQPLQMLGASGQDGGFPPLATGGQHIGGLPAH